MGRGTDWISSLIATSFVELFERKALGVPLVKNGKVVLRYPLVMRWFLGGAGVFFAALLTASWGLMANHATTWLGTVILGPLGLFCLCEMRVRIELDAQGIAGRTAFRGYRAMTWCSVENVGFSHNFSWFALRDRRGGTLRVSTMLQGHRVFVAALETHVPESIWHHAVAQWRRRAA
jgi:hypothetical protein